MTNGVISSDTKSCTGKPMVIPGQVWTYFTVLHENGRNKFGARLVMCRCRCGKYKSVISSQLRAGRVVSCGCYTRHIMKGRHLSFFRKSKHKTMEMSARSMLYIDYKSKSKKIGRQFQLTLDEFANITKKPCRYCGVEPRRTVKRKKSPNPIECLANGIDRLDNSVGYTTDNSVPCCETCNRAKLAMTEGEFVSWIKQAYLHLSKE